ncbi:MAG: hypothetical protein GIX02_11160, partial [Candidatus Eremiobacteraeota bacterium]|nr:hypothetical protein [Candidatus Eremiobacteraeota bacterium]
SGLLATALVVSSPLWLWLSPSFYVDVPFAMFVLSALLVSLTASGRVGDRKVSVLCGMLSGCAAATKLPGLADGLLILFVLGWAAKKQWVDAARWFLAAFAATAAGWYLRSYVVSGDPVYPFLSSHVGATAAIRLFAARYTFMTRHWCGGGTSLGDAVALPWRLLSDPRHYCGDPGFALRAGIVLFGLAILRRRRSLPLAGITFALTALWFVGSQQQRFFLPALFAYATLVAVGATCLTDRLRPVLTSALLALGVFAVASNWTPSLLRIASNSIVPAFAYIEGKQAAADYLSSRLESFDTARYSRSQLAPDARLVLLDDVRGYYFPSAVWGNPFYQPVWHLDWTASAGKRYRSLVARRIRYIVVNANPAYVGRTPHDIEWKVLAADSRSKAITALYSSDGVTLYEIMRSAQ